MAKSQSLLKQFTKYTNSALGLENFLRLIQSICQALAESSAYEPYSGQLTIAWTNLALSRRYFRYFQFIDCFDAALANLPGGSIASASDDGFVLQSLDVGKWSCIGFYLFLEAFTILDALGIWVNQWSKDMLLRGYTFWFFGLWVYGIAIILRMIGLGGYGKGDTSLNVKATAKEKKTAQEQEEPDTQKDVAVESSGPSGSSLLRELVIVGCDILIPGTALGWIDVTQFTVANAAIVSTLLVGMDRWAKVQASQ